VSAQNERPAHLMVSGRYESIEIHRGMRVVDETGQEIGIVAGVVVGEGNERPLHLLIGRLPLTGDYRLAPVAIVTAVQPDKICLCLELGAWDALPQHVPQLK
jgi:hypothetical protein